MVLNYAADAPVAASVKPLPPEKSYAGSKGLARIGKRNANVMFPAGAAVALTFDLGQPRRVQRVIVRSRQLVSFRGGCGVRRIVVDASNDGFARDARPFAERKIGRGKPPNRRVDFALAGAPTTARYVRVRLEPLSPKHHVYIDSVEIAGLASPEEKRARGYVFPSLAVRDLDRDGRDEIVVAGADAAAYAVDARGRVLWRRPLAGRAYQLAAADLDGDGRGEVVVGSGDRCLYCFSADGALRWKIKPPPRTYARPGYRGVLPFTGAQKVVLAADLDGDGKREIVAGAGNWRVYCFSCDGKLIWDECNWAHQPTCAAAYDLDRDGVKEVIVGNDYASAHVYRHPTGRIAFTAPATGHAGPTALAAGDLDGDGRGDLVIGDRAGRITFFEPWNAKKRKTVFTGAAITFVRLADLNRDGKPEALVGSANGYVYAFAAGARRLWLRSIGETPQDLAVVNLTGDGRPELLVAGADAKLRVWDASGRPLGLFPAGGPARWVRAAELDGDPATREFVLACDDGCVYALQWTGASAR